MKFTINKALLVACTVGLTSTAFAGNKDRIGQSGASEMLINPWARSTGVFALNGSYVTGIEAMKNNIAGLAADTTMEIGLSRGEFLKGTGINVNNLAIAIPLKEEIGVIGINVMSMGFGDVTSTEYGTPENAGVFTPQYLNFQLGYAKNFGVHTRVGFGATYISETIGNVGATGAAFEGGIQYVTGKRDNLHIGITLRNLGTNMRFSGTGLSVNSTQPQSTPEYTITTNYKSEKFSLPTYMNMGVSYDFFLDERRLPSADSAPVHKLTAMANFTSNSFINDFLGLGAEYTYKNAFQLRAAYRYEKGIGNNETTTTMYTGLSFGATAQTKIGGPNGTTLALDYSFRPTWRPANGVHMVSIRCTLGKFSKSSDE